MVERLTSWPAIRWIGFAIAFLALGAWLRGCWAPEPAVVYRDVVADSAVIVGGEPDADVGLLERVAHPVARPEQRATAPGAAAGDVARFCLAAGYTLPTGRSAPGEPAPGPAGGVPPGASPSSSSPELAGTPTAPAHAAAPSEPPSGLPPALRPDPVAIALIRSGRVGLRETELWLVRSSGDLVRESYRVRPPVTFRAAGDSVVVQDARFWWLKPLATIGLCAAGGYAGVRTESTIPVVVGCGLGAAIAVR